MARRELRFDVGEFDFRQCPHCRTPLLALSAGRTLQAERVRVGQRNPVTGREERIPVRYTCQRCKGTFVVTLPELGVLVPAEAR